ncbi:MucR family transcriptional regulator [Novosphingobium sp.]|jgi:predicted transcriptional regulator|uniref:MucR family transcriptional regulator n=1 Tax=Novosphingobium sp. TaxID=1874826 RepID=UPI0022BE6E1F|nr:MucR family transcriptional regulator [Novosphingobium sp.]MCZ8018673.1 MucR family transcriptional regulator [Novosphingobium sp.]MCZ8034678.1 MucR family transcriptional regulator [Novosphingobium sp.]MCZ8052813.1 MucR family transcriptional regulator [Novosphingobium sp.]MCZ8060571.1 MucR family transcriptional regulator [Novosphingobium sp.]MCZ8230597.1 MucR family transcriptional regulator [Novosphingobium sp.]
MEHEALVTLTADIVAAYVSNNETVAEAVPVLIGSVFSALAAAGEPTQPVVEEKLTPAVSVRSSVKPEAITCLECGFKGKMLKRHLSTEHGMSPEYYKARWSLPKDYPLVAPAYAEQRKELAVKIGLGRKPGQKRGRKKASA